MIKDSALPVLGAWVQFLVGELRSPHDTQHRQKQKQKKSFGDKYCTAPEAAAPAHRPPTA